MEFTTNAKKGTMLPTSLTLVLLLVSFNYNIPLLSSKFKPVSRYHVFEFIGFGWFGRVVVTSIFAFILYRLDPYPGEGPWSWGAPLCVFLALCNFFWTWHEIWRDRRRYLYQSAYMDFARGNLFS